MLCGNYTLRTEKLYFLQKLAIFDLNNNVIFIDILLNMSNTVFSKPEIRAVILHLQQG